MTLDELIAERKEKYGLAQSIMDLAAADGRDGKDGNDGLNEEEANKWDTLYAEAEALDAQISIFEANATRLSQMAGLKEKQEELAKGTGRKTTNQIAAPSGITDVKLLSEGAPNGGFRTPQDYLLAVMDNSGEGKITDERLIPYNATVGSDEQSGFSNEKGGFTIPEEFRPGVMELEPEDEFIRDRTMQIPMTAPSVKIAARVDKDHSRSVSGGLTVSRRAEASDIASSTTSLEQLRLDANALFGMAYVTEELLTDSKISFVALLERGFGQEMASHLTQERLNGTGVNEFLGIRNSAAMIDIGIETEQAADTIVRENIVNMRARCWGYGSAIWMANNDCYPTLSAMTLDVGTGGIGVYQPSILEDRPDLLLGRPIFFSEHLESVGDKGDIVLANWREYIEGTYQASQQAESIHVRFVQHEHVFKFWLRNAGMPWWSSQLTPKNGDSLSPFIQLNERA